MTWHQVAAIFGHETDKDGNLVPWFAEEEAEDRPDPWRGSGYSQSEIAILLGERTAMNAFYMQAQEQMGKDIENDVQKFKDSITGIMSLADIDAKTWEFREAAEERHIAALNQKLAGFKAAQIRRRPGLGRIP